MFFLRLQKQLQLQLLLLPLLPPPPPPPRRRLLLLLLLLLLPLLHYCYCYRYCSYYSCSAYCCCRRGNPSITTLLLLLVLVSLWSRRSLKISLTLMPIYKDSRAMLDCFEDLAYRNAPLFLVKARPSKGLSFTVRYRAHGIWRQ